MSDPTELLFSAFAKFVDAGFGVSIARLGLFGFWVAPVAATTTLVRDRAIISAARWDSEYDPLQNPYNDVIAFLDAGGSLGRWENNVLDVFLANGNRYGVPLSSFIRAAN